MAPPIKLPAALAPAAATGNKGAVVAPSNAPLPTFDASESSLVEAVVAPRTPPPIPPCIAALPIRAASGAAILAPVEPIVGKAPVAALMPLIPGITGALAAI